MKSPLLSKLLFPLALFGSVCISVASEMAGGPRPDAPEIAASPDTVIYPVAAYKARRVGSFEAVAISDSLLCGDDSLIFADDEEVLDTLPRLTARDTIKAPDSLRLTDPFRYKYYVAIIDSLTHRIVCDSLKREGDSLMLNFTGARDSLLALPDSVVSSLDTLEYRQDSVLIWADSLLAALDFHDCHLVDSLYLADSTARAKAAFEAWYNSLSKEARKKYDFEQKEKRKKEVRDSLDEIKAMKQAVKDSILENTPRILEAYAVPESMYYNRIIAWNVDRDFQNIDAFVPDTSYNYYFYDYKFLREDVNATWLGMAGSPVQTYDFMKRSSTGVSFYDPLETWTVNPSTMLQYNTKTPHTELAYWGTLLGGGSSKESNNIHILSTQNITPALNFSILYDAWGGEGILENEKVKNKTFAAGINHLGKRYLMNAGFIRNKVEAGENGGIVDLADIRDTTIDSREVRVAMSSAKSTTQKTTFYADNQLSIPFTFINDMKMKRDSTFVPDSTADITTAFIGHGIEYSKYGRLFENGNDVDSLGQSRLDNKLYLRLQPWRSDAIISKIDIGVGDYFQTYHCVTAADTSRARENSLYTYAGASGQFSDNMRWNAKAHYVFAGADAGNMDISAGFGMEFYPFRRARKSPVSLKATFSESLLGPTYYQRHMYSTVNELLRWDNDFQKTSTTRFQGSLDIPYWKMSAQAGYALIGNYIYYNTLGQATQHSGVISVLSASLRKEFVFGPLHLDNRLLAQYSSDQEALPLPAIAANLKYYAQFPIKEDVLTMQIGLNGWINSRWYSPQWNYITGTFNNQDEWAYTNGPFFDVFFNMQWKTCCIFIKMQNLGSGWPMDHADYFSAHRHIVTTGFAPSLKLGIWWPFGSNVTPNRKAESK